MAGLYCGGSAEYKPEHEGGDQLGALIQSRSFLYSAIDSPGTPHGCGWPAVRLLRLRAAGLS
jgi:hypothetical protein